MCPLRQFLRFSWNARRACPPSSLTSSCACLRPCASFLLRWARWEHLSTHPHFLTSCGVRQYAGALSASIFGEPPCRPAPARGDAGVWRRDREGSTSSFCELHFCNPVGPPWGNPSPLCAAERTCKIDRVCSEKTATSGAPFLHRAHSEAHQHNPPGAILFSPTAGFRGRTRPYRAVTPFLLLPNPYDAPWRSFAESCKSRPRRGSSACRRGDSWLGFLRGERTAAETDQPAIAHKVLITQTFTSLADFPMPPIHTGSGAPEYPRYPVLHRVFARTQ